MKAPRFLFALAAILAVVALTPGGVRAQSTKTALPEAKAPALPKPVARPGDLDVMLKARVVRILVPFSKTIYFLDRGAERGTAAEFGREFERWLNKRQGAKALQIHVAFVPTRRDRLLQALNEGLGDIVAANLTITPERQKLVDFSTPGVTNVREVVVTGPSSPALARLDDLAGREIHVRKSSSYWGHLEALNAQRKRDKIKLVPAAEDLEDEDLLEMVNAGLLPLAVVDEHKAVLWAKIFPKIKVRDDLVVRDGGAIAWAVRKKSPLLLKEINAFIAENGPGTPFFNEVLRKYYGSTKILKEAYSAENTRAFEQLTAFFKSYAGKYDFDYLMIAAQGFQESRLKQATRSRAGAVGIMQVLPKTAKDPKIGIAGVDKSAERNIEAGVKYLRLIVDTYLDDPKLDAKNRTLMAFAAYNAGPTNLARFRKWAGDSGLDPDVWFFNVEQGAAEIVGQETVQYVSNIYKYYVAYLLLSERQAAVQATTQGAAAPAKR
jgi:membrane-bound lytic murein transglycosylase MltF